MHEFTIRGRAPNVRSREFWSRAKTVAVGIASLFATECAIAQSIEPNHTRDENGNRADASEHVVSECGAPIEHDRVARQDLARAYDNRGLACFRSEDDTRALADFNEALRFDPDFAFAYNDRGYLHFVHGDSERALADFTNAIRLDPSSTLFHKNRGNVYYHNRDYARAMADYDQAIAIDPTFADAFNNRGVIYHDLGDYTLALASYDQAIRLDRTLANAFANRAHIHHALRAYSRAIADYDSAISLNGDNAAWLNMRCWIRATWGRQLSQALADCNASLELAHEANTLDSRGLVHLRRGEFQLAIADFDAALESYPLFAGSLYGRGIARLRLGQRAEGQADIALATRTDPEIAARYADYGLRP